MHLETGCPKRTFWTACFFMFLIFLRSVYKPHSVFTRSLQNRLRIGRSSLWADRYLPALAAYPGFKEGEQPPLPRKRGKLCPCLALLQMGVTWPWYYCRRRWALTHANLAVLLRDSFRHLPPFHPYPKRGGLFLWPDPVDFSTPGVTRHLALWSADFPRPGNCQTAIIRPT